MVQIKGVFEAQCVHPRMRFILRQDEARAHAMYLGQRVRAYAVKGVRTHRLARGCCSRNPKYICGVARGLVTRLTGVVCQRFWCDAGLGFFCLRALCVTLNVALSQQIYVVQ
jgi:hypothetical protein